MIAVDTSALMAIVLGEPSADVCIAALGAETEVLISAGTVAEAPGWFEFRRLFAYEVAMEHSCRLLFVGGDFSKTDVGSVL
jgi:ribonuclease VapC